MADDNTGSWMEFAQRSRDDGGLGLEKHQAAGVVGNLQNESGSGIPAWGPTGDNGTAWGSAQWRGDRLDALRQHAADNGLDYRTPEAQQSFMRQEFDGRENKAYRAIQAATTPEDAATAMNRAYERSADRSGRREQSARSLYDGSDGPTAIDAAMGRTRSPTGSRMAFAGDDEDNAPPALSSAAQLGPGALGANPGAAPAKPNWLDVLGSTLMNMAPGIAQDPDHAKALVEAAKNAQKTAVDQGTWTMHVLPNGQVVSVNNKTNEVRNMGKSAKDDSPKWSPHASNSPDGTAVPGYVPPYAEWVKTQTPEALAAKAAADEAALTPKLLGDASKQGPEYLATLDPVNRNLIDSIHAGTGQLPSSFKANDPKVKQLMASLVHAYPDVDLTNIPARQRLAKTLTDAAPGSNGGIIANSNTAVGILNDAADQHLALHNSGDTLGSSKLGNASNWLSNQNADSKRAGIIAHLAGNADDASGEITKVLTGGPGGVEERKTRSSRIGSPSYVPSEAAGALEGELNDLSRKHKETVDKVREQMGQSYLDRFPVIEKNFKEQETMLRGKIEQLRGAGSEAKPTTGTFNNVPWSIK